jgi:hypothetical protein
LPDEFFCFYENGAFEHLLPFVAVHVEDLYHDHPDLEEALISAGWINFGVGKRAADQWGKDYTWCDSHLQMVNRQDNGTLHTGDAREIWENEDYAAGSVAISTFAYPLVVITDCEALKGKIVTPLLDELAKEPTTQIKKRPIAGSRKKSRDR